MERCIWMKDFKHYSINIQNDSGGKVQHEPETLERVMHCIAMYCIFQTTNNTGCNAQGCFGEILQEDRNFGGSIGVSFSRGFQPN